MSSFQKSIQQLAKKKLDSALLQDLADSLFEVNMDIGEALLIVKLEFEKKIEREKLNLTIQKIMSDIEDILAPKIAEKILILVEPKPQSSPQRITLSPQKTRQNIRRPPSIRRY
jgi:hypothetical protein